MLENGLTVCSCKRVKCERHGNCAACIAHHSEKKNYPPYCKRQAEKAAKKAERAERRSNR